MYRSWCSLSQLVLVGLAAAFSGYLFTTGAPPARAQSVYCCSVGSPTYYVECQSGGCIGLIIIHGCGNATHGYFSSPQTAFCCQTPFTTYPTGGASCIFLKPERQAKSGGGTYGTTMAYVRECSGKYLIVRLHSPPKYAPRGE